MNDLKLVFRSLKRRFVVAVTTNFCRFYRLQSTENGFAWHSLDGGVRQEVQVLCWTQANQPTDQLTVINRRRRFNWAGYRHTLYNLLFTKIGSRNMQCYCMKIKQKGKKRKVTTDTYLTDWLYLFASETHTIWHKCLKITEAGCQRGTDTY